MIKAAIVGLALLGASASSVLACDCVHKVHHIHHVRSHVITHVIEKTVYEPSVVYVPVETPAPPPPPPVSYYVAPPVCGCAYSYSFAPYAGPSQYYGQGRGGAYVYGPDRQYGQWHSYRDNASRYGGWYPH
jgi:hypothetical protein